MNKLSGNNFESEETVNDSNLHLLQFEIEVSRNDLLKSLAHINGVVEKRNIISLLGNVKLEIFEGRLYLTATDMDIAITEGINATIHKQGVLTVPAQMLYEIIRKLTDVRNITLALDNKTNKLNINAGNCYFTLPALSADNFPFIECNDITHEFNLTSNELKTLIAKTKFAISTEETRYNLNGIYLHPLIKQNETFFVAAATDGHRLSQVQILSSNILDNMPGVILPRKASIELSKILDQSNDEVKIELSKTKIRFTIGNIIFITKLIDASFPDYQNFIPESNHKKLIINREVLAKAVDRVATLSIEKFSAVKLQLSPNRLDLIVKNEQYGLAHEILKVNYDNEPLEIAFNGRYILEIMSVIEGEEVSLSLSDSYSPVIIKDLANNLATYIIMPMRV